LLKNLTILQTIANIFAGEKFLLCQAFFPEFSILLRLMNNLPTLKKISEHLNISISTVSRALKDHPDVSTETIQRVKDLANLMEYEPNGFAVNLRKKTSQTYAIIVPEIGSYFYHSFIQSVEEEARQKGYRVMIMQSLDDPGQEAENLRICRYNQLAGVFVAVCSETTDLTPFQKTKDFGIPVVLFDKVLADTVFPCVTVPNQLAAGLAAQYLLSANKKKTLCLMGDEHLSITKQRLQGFLEQIQVFHYPAPEIAYFNTEQQVYEALLKMGPEKCNDLAIFCMSDLILCGAMRALYEMKISIPQQVSIIALSNGFMPRFFNPVISYVETSGYKLGKAAFEWMGNAHEKDASLALDTFIECRFVEGGSL
jgi:LacI family transcriptional regulator